MLKNEDIIYDDHYIRSILDNTKTIAMIGLSSSWQRPSYFVAKYLLDRGVNLEIIPNKRIKGYRYKSFDIKFAIQLGNDASIANKIASIKTYKPTNPTILVQSFPSKITQDKIDSWKQPNLMIMGVEEFIEWSKIN